MVLIEILSLIQKKTNGEGGSDELKYPEAVRPYLSKFQIIGERYLEVNSFLESVKGKYSFVSHLYISAFCEGVNEIMEEFHTVLCDIENEISNSSDLSLISVLHQLDPISTSIQSLAECIDDIKKKDVSGCLLIDLCYLHLHCGVPHVTNAFQLITKHCMKQFFLQTKHWVFHAALLDPHMEYFIEEIETFEETCMTVSYSSTKDVRVFKKYSIAVAKLPKFLPYSIASKILFIGNMIAICERRPTEGSNETDYARFSIKEELRDKFNDFAKTDVFLLHEFDSTITSIYTHVNRYVRTLMDNYGELRKNIERVADIYLLRRGELFQEFLHRAKDVLESKPTSEAMKTLKFVFENSVYSVYLSENFDLIEPFDFTFAETTSSKVQVWDVFEINVKLPWLLDSLFTPLAIQNFNSIFKFLLRLKKAQMDIKDIWSNTNIRKGNLNSETMLLRIVLTALISHIQYYSFFNVIDVEISHFINVLDKNTTFTEVQSEFSKMQASIIQKLFLCGSEPDNVTLNTTSTVIRSVSNLNNKVRSCFKAIFKICHQFSQSLINPIADINITILCTGLFKSIKILNYLSQAVDKNYECFYLKELMSGLNYNGYFTKAMSKKLYTSDLFDASTLSNFYQTIN